MNAIIGMGELLLHENLDERQKGYVSDIVISANTLLSIVNNILDFSKIESGKLELSPVNYGFNAFVDQLRSMFLYITEKKGLEFRLECDENLPETLYGDDIRLRQVLTNIIGNAVKFTEKGFVCLKVTSKNDMLIFEVIDSGIGVRKEDMPKIFNSFEQVDTSKNRNVIGTGLGLTISKSFIKMMDGTITLDSEYGKGTVFTITIPIVKGDTTQVKNEKNAKESFNVSAPAANILVVDDNEFNLRVAIGLMKLMDIEAHTADSGFKAIELAKKNEYDIIFMDHMMPEMDGIETTSRIRQMGGRYEQMPIIALTANAVYGAKDMFLSNGLNDFISKPIDSTELARLLSEWLPPEKLNANTDSINQQSRDAQMDDLMRKSAVTFVKENKGTFERITSSLNSKDIKTAHRIAHTLKSGAAYLGKKELQEAAASLEQSLSDHDKPEYTSKQLAILKNTLDKALREFEPLALAAEAEAANQETVQMDNNELNNLLAEIKPLLEKGDFEVVAYVDKLRGISGMNELADCIDDYNFEGALSLL
jgi:CheY-like chemotaxis protein/anti-sigma regulatory factor (Ser/Thr protein kinase)